jgi:hypothetical protein
MEKDSFEFYSLFDDRVRECQKNSLERKHSLTDFLGSGTEIFSDRELLFCKDWLLSFEAFGFEVFDFEISIFPEKSKSPTRRTQALESTATGKSQKSQIPSSFDPTALFSATVAIEMRERPAYEKAIASKPPHTPLTTSNYKEPLTDEFFNRYIALSIQSR